MIEYLWHLAIWLSVLGVATCDVLAFILAVDYAGSKITNGYLSLKEYLNPCFDALHRAFLVVATSCKTMETLASQTLGTLQSGKPIENKLKFLTDLKQEIKHRQCPATAVPTIFQVVRISIGTPHLVDAGFSILSHLTKRLVLQDHVMPYHEHFMKLLPALSDRLGDTKGRLRMRAIAALSDAYSVSPIAEKDLQQYVCGTLLVARNPRMKESAMQFVVTQHEESGMLFRMFVPGLVDCCEDADGSVRMTAQNTIIALFRNAETKAKKDLEKRLEKRGVRKAIVTHIRSEVLDDTAGPASTGEASIVAPTPEVSRVKQAPPKPQPVAASTASDPPLEAPPMSVSEQEAVSLDPLYMESSRELEDTFREIQPWFEGKEVESNWLRREKSILKLRRIVKGNAPIEYTILFLANIKTLLDGILKAVNSLRTTVCTIGCHLVQDLARVCGPGLDNMVEILLQNLIKLCGNTKKISASKANDTVNAIMGNVSLHVRLLQHIYFATQDKNVQPRTFACGWLATILTKHGHNKSSIEHSGGLDFIEKSITTGLNDGNPAVRENMRSVYWTFAKIWSEKSENIMSSLSKTHQDMLIKHSANPNPPAKATSTAGVTGKSAFSQSTGAAPSRPSIKETIAAQKKAKAAGKNLPERPGSAESFASPTKTMAPTRPATAMSTSSRHGSSQSVGTLSSAPVRPRRRADLSRPTTADAPVRKPSKPETPQSSPAPSPAKRRPKTPGFAASAVKLAPKKVNSPLTDTPKANSSKKVNSADTSPTKAAEDFTMVVPSFNKVIMPPMLSEYVTNDGPLPSVPTAASHLSSRVPEPQAVSKLNNIDSNASNVSTDGSWPSSSTAPSQSSFRVLEPDVVSNLGHTTYEYQSKTSTDGPWPSSSIAPSQSSFRVPAPDVISNLGHTIHDYRSKGLSNGASPSSSIAPSQSSFRVLEAGAASNLGNTGHEHQPKHPDNGRISMSPRKIVGRKENMKKQQQWGIYEDSVDGTTQLSSEAPSPARALEMLPVNEPARYNRLHNAQSIDEKNRSTDTEYENRLTLKQREARNTSSSDKLRNPLLARRLLDSAIVRIQDKTLDVHAYHKVQNLWPSAPDSIWEDGYKFEELLLALLDTLEAPSEAFDPNIGCPQDIKSQAMTIIKLLMMRQRQYFDKFYPQAICTLIVARQTTLKSSHLRTDMETMIEAIVGRCDPVDTVPAVLDVMDLEDSPEIQKLCLATLATLLHKSHITTALLRDKTLRRVAIIARESLDKIDPQLRNLAMPMVSELYHIVHEAVFWALVDDEVEGRKAFITYYLARNGHIHATSLQQ